MWLGPKGRPEPYFPHLTHWLCLKVKVSWKGTKFHFSCERCMITERRGKCIFGQMVEFLVSKWLGGNALERFMQRKTSEPLTHQGMVFDLTLFFSGRLITKLRISGGTPGTVFLCILKSQTKCFHTGIFAWLNGIWKGLFGRVFCLSRSQRVLELGFAFDGKCNFGQGAVGMFSPSKVNVFMFSGPGDLKIV